MNKQIYKKTVDQIKAPAELKEKTFEKIMQNQEKHSSISFRKILATCTIITIVFLAGVLYINNQGKPEQDKIISEQENTKIAKQANDLPRFENMEQLKEVLKTNELNERKTNNETVVTDSITEESVQEETNYSTTNIQVENVDEADIVKTDGEYIYYVTNEEIYIIKAKELKIITEIKFEEQEQKKFYPSEIYINKDKMVILGNTNSYQEMRTTEQETIIGDTVDTIREYATIQSQRMATALVYDISIKETPKLIREVGLEGYYTNSRMIGDNIYFISTKNVYLYDGIKDEEILPILKDTASENVEKRIACTDIAYFGGTESSNYMLVAGFNINNNEEASTETFFGANDTVYASQNNLYIAETKYEGEDYTNCKSIIYKFNLNEAEIRLQCKGEVKGNLNNQFSIDEYEGNLRIATTNGYDENSSNQLYILDENLKEIGKIENLANGERIYSVRFIGDVGYIVTFEQVDPLFVIDLSEPTNPLIKGELKIPGYSSYLHPYDETHIIGIGYNTKSNGYGGVTNSTMKMSMFDVSDLENPKEIFNIDIGENYAYSEITSNHKTLFYNKEQNLIGFPITYRYGNASKDRNGLVIYKIDLEKGFEKYGEILQEIDYRTNIDRAIYIENTLYTLSETKIISYDLGTINKMQELEL